MTPFIMTSVLFYGGCCAEKRAVSNNSKTKLKLLYQRSPAQREMQESALRYACRVIMTQAQEK